MWMETCPEEAAKLVRESELSADQSGQGEWLHSFVPYCTLLYNIVPMEETDRLSKG